jgi:hypothetical protein
MNSHNIDTRNENLLFLVSDFSSSVLLLSFCDVLFWIDMNILYVIYIEASDTCVLINLVIMNSFL